MLRSFRYRCEPTPSQEALLRRTIGCCRLVYNKALAERSDAWADGKKLSYAEQDKRLTAWKRTDELAFLNEVSCSPLQQAIRHLQRAYVAFFQKRAKYPAFKKRRNGGSASFTKTKFRLRNGELFLAKMMDAPLYVRWSRPLPVDVVPSKVTVSLDSAGRWHVSIQCDDTTVKPLKRSKRAVAIDLGLAALATLSTGECIPNPKHDAAALARRKLLSRRLSRTQKGSRNRTKAALKLGRVQARIADRRRDYLHKLTTRLVRENQVIVAETLEVTKMAKHPKLARAIYDAGWGELIAMLAYKCRWYGRDLIKVGKRFPSTRTCSVCKAVRGRLGLGERRWRCECGAEHDRDHNAAKNILAAGLAVSACGAGVSHRILRGAVQSALKQEPAS